MNEIKLERGEPDEFEVQLAQALRRVDAPEGFAARLMERTGERVTTPRNVVTMRPRFAVLRIQAWVGGAIAAALVLGVLGVEQMHVRREREQATLAQQQFETATRITDQALSQVRAQLAQAGVLGE